MNFSLYSGNLMRKKPLFLILISLGLAQAADSTEKAIELLDQIREAQAYWEVMARDKRTSFFKRPTHQWFNKEWKSEVANHQKSLTDAEDQLIEFLAALSEDQKKLSYESVYW